MTSIYDKLTKSLEFSRKSNYDKLDILDKQLEENKINEGKYLREVNKLKIKDEPDEEWIREMNERMRINDEEEEQRQRMREYYGSDYEEDEE